MISTDEIKEKLTTDDIIKLATSLQGSDEYYYDAQGHPIFSTVLDHPETGGDSWKLYFYPETKLFHCYTGDAATYDVFELVRRARQCDFKEAYNYIINFFHFDEKGFGFVDDTNITSLGEWDIFQKVDDYVKRMQPIINNPAIPENLLEYFFPLAAPTEWMKEGIAPEVMRAYGIRIDSALSKIIIPHRDINGKLVGIRGRAFDPIEVADGKKYMPIYIEGKMYNHSLGKNLFGLYENKETIKRLKKVCVFEAEKSVLQIASMYGLENSFAVATCGSSLSAEQVNLLLNLGVTELVLAFDADHKGLKGSPDVTTYEEKLLKIVERWLPYVNVSIIFDYDHLLPYKGSPSDCGKEIFEKLYHSRMKLYTEEKQLPKRKRRF